MSVAILSSAVRISVEATYTWCMCVYNNPRLTNRNNNSMSPVLTTCSRAVPRCVDYAHRHRIICMWLDHAWPWLVTSVQRYCVELFYAFSLGCVHGSFTSKTGRLVRTIVTANIYSSSWVWKFVNRLHVEGAGCLTRRRLRNTICSAGQRTFFN